VSGRSVLALGRQAREEQVEAELEALLAVGNDAVHHRGDQREPAGGQPPEVVADGAQVILDVRWVL
jgi:hypothetical protein